MSGKAIFVLSLALGVAIGDPIRAWEKLALSGKVKTLRPLQVDDDKPIPAQNSRSFSDNAKPSAAPHRRLIGPADKFWLPKRTDEEVSDPLLFGGVNAQRNIAPGMVSIQTKTGDDVTHTCGGSLAAPNKVLSAAHCFEDFEESEWQVALGYHVLTDGLKNPNSQVIKVDYVEYHELYDFSKTDSPYDIALVTLVENAVITPGYVEIMKYSTKLAADLAGSSAYLIGWGYLEHTGTAADTLQYGDYTVISTEKCREYWPDSTVDKDRNVCAKSEKSADCMGDSGGPLLDSQGTQIGIVSWGDAECNPKQPGVFVSVAFYDDWTTF